MFIREFIKADTPERLADMCNILTLNSSMEKIPFEPVFFAKGFYYTFYTIEVDIEVIKRAMTKDKVRESNGN